MDNGKLQNDSDFYSFLNGIGDTNSFVAQIGDLKVTQSASPGLSVLVTTGKVYAYVGSKTSYYGGTLNAATTLTIGSNSSGSTRIDLICVKYDTAATSNTAGDNLFSLQVVPGTPGAGVPATPANYYKIAEVSVINGAAGPTHIVNADITDKRNFLTITEGATQYNQITTPSNPPSGANKMYFKSDGNPYMLNSSGTEQALVGTTAKARAYLTGNQSIPTATWTKVTLNTKSYDPGTNFDATTNYRFTAPIAGKYLVCGAGQWGAVGDGVNCWVGIYKNGAEYTGVEWYSKTANRQTGTSITDVVDMGIGDYVELWAYQSSGSAVNLVQTIATANTYMSVHLLSIG